MATKIKSVFFCQSCGYESSKWMGQCPGCREWNSFVEETVKPQVKVAKGGTAALGKRDYVAPKSLSEIEMNSEIRMSAPFSLQTIRKE